MHGETGEMSSGVVLSKYTAEQGTEMSFLVPSSAISLPFLYFNIQPSHQEGFVGGHSLKGYQKRGSVGYSVIKSVTFVFSLSLVSLS